MKRFILTLIFILSFGISLVANATKEATLTFGVVPQQACCLVLSLVNLV